MSIVWDRWRVFYYMYMYVTTYRREIIIRIKRENDYESLNLPDRLNKTEIMNILQIKMFNYIKHEQRTSAVQDG